jgi:hypothetical protein
MILNNRLHIEPACKKPAQVVDSHAYYEVRTRSDTSLVNFQIQRQDN